MNPIVGFYDAFSRLDAEEMISFYHDDVWFADPAFGQLKGEQVKNMWRMLLESQKGKPFLVKAHHIKCDDFVGSAQWEAKYTFGKSGRRVHNKINARFKLHEGKIISHLDDFNLHRWATQAMGFQGWLIGWTGFFQRKLHKQTNAMLHRYERKTEA